ncbi:hypothetical protein BRADI_4g03550v3 [Brachypodium distachyon]|uniref:BED-type domain-containing protein n=1 Tax=Brachypodium distachyon TaxID=15368 RepID=I1IH49_BRADI|nr:hypothetical protein BRADI_4g03550v3 [Brachypodium distachyon]
MEQWYSVKTIDIFGGIEMESTSMPQIFDTDGPLSPLREDQLRSIYDENPPDGVGLQRNPKRPRSTSADGKSIAWTDFTKIYVQDERGGYKLAYAVCHICDNMLKAASDNGTKTLWRHKETSSCKQLKQQTQ